MFIAALFTIAKSCKQPKCLSVDEWIKKLWYIYTMECYVAERNRKEFLPFMTAWMKTETKLNKPISEDKYHRISLIRGI